MLDEELIGTQDVRLEFSNGKELDSWDVIRYAQEQSIILKYRKRKI